MVIMILTVRTIELWGTIRVYSAICCLLLVIFKEIAVHLHTLKGQHATVAMILHAVQQMSHVPRFQSRVAMARSCSV